LLVTTKMLASTVKFSRCGRYSDQRLRRRLPIRWKASCLCDRTLRTQQRAWASAPYTSRFHSCKAGSTDDESDEEAYWSMFHSPAPARLQSKAGEPSAWTDLPICQMAP
jgi:hypothetical protein